MRLRIPGPLAWAVAGLVAVVGAAILIVHTPPVARWSRDWVVRQVAARWGLDLATSGLSYNLYTGRVAFDDVRLSAPGHGDEPFFAARRVSALLPWSVVRGHVRLDRLEVDDATVRLVRVNGTIVNLPPSSGEPPPADPRRLDLGALDLRGLDVDYVDRTGDVDVQVRGLRAALAPGDRRVAAGPGGPVTAASIMARVGARATTSGAIAGRLAFDGSNLTVAALTAPFPEARVVANGPISRVLDDVRFGLTLDGALDLAALTAWMSLPVPVSGPGSFEGTFTGPLGGYVLNAKFGSDRMAISRVPGVSLAGVLTLTSPRAIVEPLVITTPAQGGTTRRGSFDGRVSYEFGEQGAFDLGGAFRDLDLDLALALYDQDPLSVAAWQAGTVSMRRDTPLAPMRMRASGRSTPLTRVDRVALDGTWDATLEHERWFVRHDHRLLDTARAFGALHWAAGGDPATTTLAGPLTLEVSAVGPAIRAARQSGIGMAAALVDLKGTAHGALTVGGTLERTLVTGRVTSTDLVLPTGAGATAGADLVYDETSLGATAFELATPGAQVHGHVTMGMTSSRLDGAFDTAIDSLPAFLASWTDASGVTGTLHIAGTIGGTTDVPDVPLRVRSTPIMLDTQLMGTIEGAARLLGTDLRVDHLVLDQGPGQLRVSGHIDYESYAYDTAIDGTGLTWTRPVAGVNVDAVAVNVSFAGAGTLSVPGGSGTLSITPSGGVSDLVGAAEVRWQFANDGDLSATMFLPKLRAWTQATVTPRAPYVFSGTALVSRLDVQPLALSAGALTDAVSGTVGFSAAFQGRLEDLPAATAFVNLQDLDLSVGGLPVRLDRPARVTVRADDFTVDDLAVHAGNSALVLAGRVRDPLNQPLRASFKGDVADVVALGRAFGAVPVGVSARGTIDATWESRGGLERASSTVSIAGGAVEMTGLPAIDGLAAHATFDGAMLGIDTLTANWQGGVIVGRASIPRGLLVPGSGGPIAKPGRVDLTVKGLTEQALATWLPPASLASMSGRVSATLGLDLTSAQLSGLRGSLVLDEASVTASGVPLAQTRPSQMSIAGGVLTFDDVEFSAGVPVNIGGYVAFAEATEFNVWITGTPSLRPLSVLSPQLSMDGVATLDLALTGTPAAPRLNGRIDLDDAEMVMRDPRVIASDLTGPILFQGDRISMPGLRGFVNGGDLEASGTLQYTGADVTTGDVTFQLRGVSIEYPRNVDSEIDALLVLSAGVPAPVLHGDVRVLRSSYRATISVPALVAFNAATVADAAVEPGYLDRVRLDVSLATDDDMIVDNNYGRFEAGADLRLQGTVARPGVTGRAELREGGEVFLLGGLYRLDASTISFTNPTAIEPDMSISMTTQQNRSDVTVSLTGTLDRLQTSVSSSDPDATSQNLVTVLLGGNTSLDRTDAVALLSGDLLGVTGRALGLDALRIERSADDVLTSDLVRQDPGLIAEVSDPSTRLTLSKRLRSDVEVILSQDLRQSGLTAVVSYRPWRGVELRGTSRDNTDRAYAVRHEIAFGGGAAVAKAPPRPRVDVADVRIDGATPDEERSVRGAMTLERGRPFDFIKWRRDVDRLNAWYRQHGFLEARVRASRTPDAADGRMVLTYRITRGPRTELQVTGRTLTARLRLDLERAWSDSVFDGFRLEEMQRVVALDLVRHDVIGARVEAAVSGPAAGPKVITVHVQGGTQVASRAVAFEGAESITAASLTATVKARGLSDYVWIDPPAIAAPVLERYKEAGFRATAVTPGAIRFDNGRAVLPVAVAEGPLTTVLQVKVTGVSDDLTGAVQAIVHPLEGRAYRDVTVDDARRKVEALYRARGFNGVQVSPSVALKDGHIAELSLAVETGRAQRLQEVVVDGNGRTKASAVVNALRLEPGTPADLAQWAQARKRVFDTNVFRQVEVRPEVVSGTQTDGTEQVRARVTVTEWPAWRLRYGVQLNDTNQAGLGGDTSLGRTRDLGVVGDLQNRNAFGRAFTFGLYGRVERRLQSSSAYLTFPTLFGRAVQTNVFASAYQQDTAFDDAGVALLRRTKSLGSLEQRIRRGRSMEVAYGYRLSREVLRPFDAENPFFQETIVGRFTSTAFYDRRNDPFDASRGWFGSLSVERISEFESNSDSVKLLGTAYHYQPLGQVTAASAVRVGTSLLDPLPFLERFFVGGAVTVRGYSENAVGPKDLSGFARGGNTLLTLSQELRAPIYKWLRGVVFVDAGRVSLRRQFTLSDLQVGYGAGVRLYTPFSTLRVDLGFPASGGGRRVYFGIGQVF